MAIYIKGVDIPTNCTDCRYRPLVGCNPYQDNGLSPSDHRHRTCPLTEVAEPHGRLIDAEALQTAEINCVHCPRYYEVEDDIGVHSHCGGSHGRLIDADALMEYCSNQKSKTISNNDIARFPTISADRPHGEWIDKGDYAVCSKCGGSSGTQFDGVEPIPKTTAFCPNCGARMKGGDDE